jgi:hypothetical protein
VDKADDKKQACRTCRFYTQAHNARGPVPLVEGGECRRYPKKPLGSVNFWGYPPVKPNEWCGEWKSF